MTTKVQKQALEYMVEVGGQLRIITGYKTVQFVLSRSDKQPLIVGSAQFFHGMKCNSFIEPVTETPWADHLYRITDAGRKAIGRA